MAVAVDEFDYLCRLCAAKTGICMGLPIFEAGEQLRNIDKKIAVCLPVQVSVGDQLPKVVCPNCAYKLDQMFDFREKCLHTEGMFMEMLKEIKAESVQQTLGNVQEIPVIQNNLDEIHHRNMDSMQSCIDEISNGECISNGDANSAMQVMDEMDLAGREQVVTAEDIGSQGNDIEVATIDCLDGETVRMVDEHIREVSNHEIAMHLEDNITVVGDLTVDGHLSQLGINYVTTIATDNPRQEQIVHYCDSVKYETVIVKEEYERLQERLAVEVSTSSLKNNVSNDDFASSHHENNGHLEETILSKNDNQLESLHEKISSTSHESEKESEIIVEYTKKTKESMLENILGNLTMDEMGSSWYVCPLCSKATSEPGSMAAHFEQHFCGCNCGLYFTSVEVFSLHAEQCDFSKSKSSVENKVESPTRKKLISESSQKSETSVVERNDVDETKSQTSVKQKWTPKVCAQCGKQYRTNYKLQEHMRTHTGEKPYQCQQCEKAFRSKIGLAQHTAMHTGEFDYSCSTCGKGFQCKSYLIVHQRVHSDLKPYPCSTCGQNFKTKQSLLDHQNRHMGVKPYVCEVCGRGFITKGLCKSHQKIHSGKDNRQYPCKICNKLFVSKSYLNTHLRIHTGEKPYLCEVCGKDFLTRVDLKIHSTMHTGEKSFKCEMCSKVFARRAALRCHRRSHTGERPYACNVCGKTFTQFSPMAIHKRLHTGERPYECDVCGRGFVSKSTMMCHRKKNHVATNCDATAKNESPGIALKKSQNPLEITPV